ncbi:oxidoreductase [Devosia pacifica]|uniref:Oxidoreductase n=1 Tax=Devosia pacifica TaxID=1335967 RepID=A0A918S889_9HYPH|nr:aldo/keto reductase [Devosia pacifica]GHA26810.1 oxidoreductase [Devosia pacifica]
MTELNAAKAGTFAIGGDLEVNRLGFGAMRVTGDGIWGDPADPEEARRTLRRLPELNINFIDTAEAYGPFTSELMLAEVLAPYKNGLTVATKGGNTRAGPNDWRPVGRAGVLIQGVKLSLRHLKLEQLPLWQLHRIDPDTPREEQFSTMAEMQKEGLVRHLGLSEVSVADIEEASKYFKVATVQNHYNLTKRDSEDVLEYCEKNGIGFIPWFPLAGGELAKSDQGFAEIVKKHDASPSQIALAWVLKRSKVMLPIPGTGKVKHLEENVAAADIELSDEDFKTLDAIGRKA